MKFVVLLALVGLVSCEEFSSENIHKEERVFVFSVIEYRYVDEHGREVKVEVEAEPLGLGLEKDTFKPTMRKASHAPVAGAPVRFEQVRQPESHFIQIPKTPKPTTRTQFVQVPEAHKPTPTMRTKFVHVPETPKPTAETRFVRVVPAPKPQPPPAQTRFIHVEPVSKEEDVETKFVQLERAPVPRQEVRYVQVHGVSPQRPEVEEVKTHFVHVAAPPTGAPITHTRFVGFDDDIPTVFQTSRTAVPAIVPRQLVHHFPAHPTLRVSGDNSPEK